MYNIVLFLSRFSLTKNLAYFLGINTILLIIW